MDFANYAVLKAAGACLISKTPNHVLIATFTHYDPQTGKSLPSTVEGLSVDALMKEKAVWQAQIDQINQVLADIAALP